MTDNNRPNRADKDALGQYRKLLADYGADIARHTVPAIEDVRKAAADLLLGDRSVSLHTGGNAENHYANPAEMFAPDFGVNIMRLPVTADIDSLFRCGIPALSSLVGVTVNDTFRPTDRLLRLMPEGVTVTAFSRADDRSADIIRRYYGTIAKADNGAVALNTAFAQDGILIHVARDTRVDKPIQLINILKALTAPDGRDMPVLAVRRLLVVMERGAEADVIVCDHDVNGQAASASSRVTEIYLGENARLALCELEESSLSTARHAMTFVSQQKDSHLSIFSGSLKPGVTRNDFVVALNGPGASVELNGMAILDDDRVTDNCTTVLHNAQHSHSDQTFKYLVNDSARGAFHGLIRVAEGAEGTEAYQTNRNILASTEARMHSQPQLEIYCDDVKCSHGSATGQLDEQALFYMRSRGIDLPEARSMLMNAFMADVIEKVKPAQLGDRLRHIVERRLSGHDDLCQTCNIC